MQMQMLRDRETGGEPEVTHVELFFDLVYVFAFIQISHHLLEHLSVHTAIETLLIYLGVWWAWNYTAWAANWIDPNKPAVRALMLVLMLLSLVMSTAIGGKLDNWAMVFALAYVSLQAIRSLFMVYALRGQRMGRNYAQLLAWTMIAGVFWIAGAFAHDEARLVLWAIAIVLDYAAPLHGFRLPRLGGTDMRDWTLSGGHLAERNQLVIIIALGESILEIGLTLGHMSWSTPVISAFLVGFVITVSLWWMYFVRQAEDTFRVISASDDPARLGRAAYAYGHGIMVGGIIVIAVAIAEMITNATQPPSIATVLMLIGGPAIYLAGNALFNYALWGYIPWSRLLGIVLLLILGPISINLTALTLGGMVAAILLALALMTGTPRRPESEAVSATG